MYCNNGTQVSFTAEEQQKMAKKMVQHQMERVDRTMWDDVLKNRNEYFRAEAFSQMETMNGRTLVMDKRGALHCVLDTDIREAYHIIPNSLHRTEGHYLIRFGCSDIPLEITDAEFAVNGTLIDKIIQHTRLEVKLLVSKKHTAELLRQMILKIVREVTVQFYFGWLKANGTWVFDLNGDTTHSRRNMERELLLATRPAIPAKTVTEELMASEQMAYFFATIANPEVRTVVSLWFHAAVLNTLTKDFGYCIKMGLCLFSEDGGVLRRLEAILGSYGDKTIELSASKRVVSDQLCERKDQTCLMRDRMVAKGNDDMIFEVINTGMIPIDKKRENAETELHGLITILSNSVTKLNQSRHIAIVGVADADLEKLPDAEIQNLKKYVNDYLRGFCGYVGQNLANLEKYLAYGMDRAYDRGENLSQEAMLLLGVLLGVSDMVRDYIAQLAPNEELREVMERSMCQGRLVALVKALENATEMGCNTDDLVDCFQVTVEAMIRQGRFDSRQMKDDVLRDGCEECKVGITYSDESCICFTRPAFRAVCEACGVSVPVMGKALREAGMLKGCAVNSESYLTRITVWDVFGMPQTKRVYKIERADLNQ